MQRAFGLTLVASICIFSGGLTILMIIIEIIDSISKFGWDSLSVANFISFQGFLRHLVLPILLYNVGIGILLFEPWSRRAIVYIVPFMFIFFLANEKTLIFWLFLTFGLIYYFTRPEIKRQFIRAPQVDSEQRIV